jgi:hypothetical protein
MPPSGNDRSVHAQNITGASIVTGDSNTVTATIHVTLPPAHAVDPKSELAALKKILDALNVPERGKLDRAMQDAEEEAAKPNPDKDEIGGAVKRVLKAAKGANEFAEQAEKLAPRIAALAAWVGPAGHALLSLVGATT